ncbi:hypothetical protein AKJ09_05401 [Labilithrix luteola]|uniref:Uncharacterized protein n=1 Tax=Labilithrix luteola TaxID=1391654 RepID=A0A0K1PZ27_9BACT|nr:hypothetical protein [Labilithrix luteola]AKU98737.1 hypothetical protein AKJ09_05401 [Labilithrix luteola]
MFRLDAHAAGDHDDGVGEHLALCTACADYVERLHAEVRRHAEDDEAKAAEFVLDLTDRQRAHAAIEHAQSQWRARPRRTVVAGLSILVAAAGLALVAQNGIPLTGGDGAGSGQSAIRFKGKLQLAVIRDRSGDQTRSATEVRVRPGDRLRAEISVDYSRPVEVGFLGKDGTWVLLLAPALVEAGTYFSDRAAQFDEAPTEGWILAGRPEDVKRAKSERSFENVRAIPVVAEP